MGIVQTEKQMYNLGIFIGERLEESNILLLEGDLGAGKTTLTQGIAKGLGISEMITSPTFVLINEYLSGKKKCYHMDLYRVNNIEELYEIGIEDYLGNDNVCIIEWPDTIRPLLPSDYTTIQIKKIGNERELHVVEVLGNTNIQEAINEYFSL